VHACTCRSKDHVTSARASATGGGRYGEIRFADSEIEIVQEGRLALRLLLPLQVQAGASHLGDQRAHHAFGKVDKVVDERKGVPPVVVPPVVVREGGRPFVHQ